jgi:putative flippase GtrA
VYAPGANEVQRGVLDSRVQADIVDTHAQAHRRGRGAAILSSRGRRLRPTLLALMTARRRALSFIAVGVLAAAVHWTVVVAIVEGWQWPALAANVVGWLVALLVSFSGHHRITFAGHGVHWSVAGRRFALISAGGFAVNESAYAIALQRSGVRYDLLLAIVLLAVATLTYLLSRHWAFLRS